MLPGFEGLIPAELIGELAKSARLVPKRPPGGAESGYTPSAKLAEFVRCRDLTCRAPGCDRPATSCDADHTIPLRVKTRAQNRAARIATECRHNRDARLTRKTSAPSGFGPAPPEAEEPPPF